MGKVVMNASVSVDGFIAAENDDPGPIFEWLVSGDVPLDDSGVLKVSQASLRPHPAVLGRDRGDHRRPPRLRHHGRLGRDASERDRPRGRRDVTGRAPEGWDLQAPFHFVDGIEAAVAKAQELAGDRTVEFAAGDVGGQALAAGLVDEVRMDVAPVVLGSGKRYFGSVDAQHLLEGPDVVVQGNRVLHLRYRVRR